MQHGSSIRYFGGMEGDHYRTLTESVQAEVRVQRSRFLALAFPIAGEAAFEAALASIRRERFDATHHCWAWRLFDPERSRSSDAGEPSGSAGRPILQAIQSAELHDIGVVVVRWFGGVKLGTGGLARAYRDAAQEALRSAAIQERWIYERISVTAPHRDANLVFRMVRPPEIVLASSEFGTAAHFELDVRRDLAGAIAEELEEARLEVKRR
ncbi:MAG TPA: YigZ family protein [Thermoanaerobaculia bacterium]|nr:YigZ family protein [Thermoanaerobaculia bacterium]